MKTCAVCTHSRRAEIDRLIVDKVSLRDIAGQTGTTRSALHRHSLHIPGALTAAKEVEKIANAETLLEQVRGLTQRTISILDRAENSGKLPTALAAIREVRGCMELLGKISGELQAKQGAVAVAQVNVHTAAETEAIRESLIAKLMGIRAATAAEV